MTNQIRNPNDRKVAGRFLLFAGVALVALGAMGACWWAARGSLGLFIGGLFVVTFLGPGAVLEGGKFVYSVFGMMAVVAPVAGVWLAAVATTDDTIGQWVRATIVVLAYGMTVGGIALGLARIKVPGIFAMGIAVVMGMAWLTWPVWLSGMSGDGVNGVVQRLVPLNPGLTINGILTGEPGWTERSVAYHLTNLNQDVAIQLPNGAARCAGVDGIAGAGLWMAGFLGTRKKPHGGAVGVQGKQG